MNVCKIWIVAAVTATGVGIATAVAVHRESAVPVHPFTEDALRHQTEAQAQEIERRFGQAVVMLHAKKYDHAITALHRVLELAPAMPEAHVNMGYALLGLERFKAAGDFFAGALALRPSQANAYFGLALALDAQHDRAGALGAMRTYVHLAPPDDPYVRRARAALWEWQASATERATLQTTPTQSAKAPQKGQRESH